MSDFWGAAGTPPVPGGQPAPGAVPAPPPPAAGFTPVAPAVAVAPVTEQSTVPSYWQPGMAVASSGPQYGSQLEALPETGQPRRIAHRPWSTVLLVFHVLQLVAAVFLLGAGLIAATVLGGDPAGGDMAGFGGLFVMIGLIAGAVLLGVSVLLLVLTRRGRARADQGQPGTLFAVGIIATALGALSLAGLIGGGEPVYVVVNLATSAVYTFAGVRTIMAARS